MLHQVNGSVQDMGHLRTLLTLSRELLGAHSYDGMLTHALSCAMELLPGAQGAAIYLSDAASRLLTLAASVGAGPPPDLSQPTDQGLMGAAFATQTTRLEVRPDGGTLTVPLLAGERALGVLLLHVAVTRHIDAARPALEELASITAAAIIAMQRHTEDSQARQVARLEQQQQAMARQHPPVQDGLLQAARFAAVGQLASALAHEVNNPLYAARSGIYLLEQDLQTAQVESPYLSIVRDELARIAAIMERMREFAQPAQSAMAPHDLNQLLAETLNLTALPIQSARVRLVFTPSPDLPPVYCNSDQVRQVWLNLILNAVEAMPGGGDLTIRTTAGASVALVEITDSGIGIPATIRSRIFQPFFTTRPEGTGLGLAISAAIVAQHGGQIEVESVEGQGSVFRVALPYAPQ